MATWCWCVLLLSGLQTLSAHLDFFTSIGKAASSRLWRASVQVDLSTSDLSRSGQMTDLLYTEKDLVTSLKDYIKAEENKLERVKRCVCVHARARVRA